MLSKNFSLLKKEYMRLITLVFAGKGRTSQVIQNVALSSILKVISIGISFVMVPITLSYLSRTGYGLWAALSSVLSWFFIFDIGIGNGLRNKFTELKANNKTSEIKYYVSTAYFIFFIIALIIVIVFVFANMFINWTKLLNAPENMTQQIRVTVLIVFISMCFIFVAKLINTILQADMRNAVSDSFTVIYSSMTLIGIIILKKTTQPSLVNFALLYTCSTFLVTLVISVILYSTLYKDYAPKIKHIRWPLWRPLASVGVKFFFIQICSLVLFQTTGLILSNLVGPESVADYTITLRYFSVASMVFMMLIQPLWTGYGDAYHQKDYDWIRRTFRRLIKLWVLLTAFSILMLVLQKFVFHIWLKGRIEVNLTLSILFVLFYSLQMFAGIYEPFINATSKLRLQLVLSAILIPLFIPFSVFLVKYEHFGPAGILVALIILNGIPMTIFSAVQSHKILNNAPGIWNK